MCVIIALPNFLFSISANFQFCDYQFFCIFENLVDFELSSYSLYSVFFFSLVFIFGDIGIGILVQTFLYDL